MKNFHGTPRFQQKRHFTKKNFFVKTMEPRVLAP